MCHKWRSCQIHPFHCQQTHLILVQQCHGKVLIIVCVCNTCISLSIGSPVPSSSIDQPDLAFVEAFTPELKEKMAKLEKENEILLRRLEVENPFNTTARSEDVVAKMHVDQLKAESLVTAEKLFSLESSNKELSESWSMLCKVIEQNVLFRNTIGKS